MHFLYDSLAYYCPPSAHFASSAAFCSVSCFLGLCFATTTTLLYNGLVVYEGADAKRVIRAPTISNTFWIFYFLHEFLRCGLDALRFGESEVILDTNLTLGAYMVQGLCAAFLGIALLYQRRHRSGARTSRYEEFHHRHGLVHQLLAGSLSLDATMVVLVVIQCSALYVSSIDSMYKRKGTFWIFVGARALQYLPVACLTVAVCTTDVTLRGGPGRTSKALLACGIVLKLPVGMLPDSFWKHFVISRFSSPCMLSFSELVRCLAHRGHLFPHPTVSISAT
eukprot:NODE_4431_length_1065_cov_97.645435_g4230_i0.p1 GENE.NODE_4431_length_1065_cov_97.645435_g4230_i0~~NODE_4431_length_1065_cov_97.645435_g4230_i0.p1  ORF type:complete len:280 (+),score=19.08 NODE_4431_length_1065_cov_97.645435_g4230_i0:51-890(+)